MSDIFKCDNCGLQGPAHRFQTAHDLWTRLDYNGPYTDKECPECGALAYLVKPQFKSEDKVRDAADRLTDANLAKDAADKEHASAVREFLTIMADLSRALRQH